MTSRINKQMIEELKDIMEEDFPLLIDTFITDSDKRLNDLQLAVSQQNAVSIRELAHGFKGSSSNLGAEKLAEISFSLETMGRTEQLVAAENTLKDLADEYKIVHEYFKSL
ncbi:MAG: histidine kinase [Gammaproteobacteria bacterium]|nr:MAG: histidine kinase [Gammaproteobacteria bacterium]